MPVRQSSTFDALRFDPLTTLHKAVRHLMFETLTQVGALDASDIFEVERCVRQVARLVALLPATGDRLEPLLAALRQRDCDARGAAATALYRELTQVVSEQLLGQLELEAERTPALQAQYTDSQLRIMRRAQLAAMSEPDLAEALRAMAEALTPQELVAVLDDLQMSVDAQTFGCLLDTVRRQTASGRWQRLARALGLTETGDLPLATMADSDFADSTARGERPRRGCRADRNRMRAQ